MNTFVRALASLFKSDRTVLPNDELKVLFNKALNWLHIPAVSNSACALLQNLLQWRKFNIKNYCYYKMLF